MSKKFDVIVADPPWPFSDKLRMSDVKRGASANYSVMTISDIQQLPVKDLCASTGAVLSLWVPGSLLQEGLDTMKAWGFAHKQTYVWVKTKKQPLKDLASVLKPFSSKSITLLNLKSYITQVGHIIKDANINAVLAFGMGRLFRQTHELCLIGTSNNQIYKKLANKSQRSVSFGENLKHSAKPEHLQDSLEIMFPQARKLELFARRLRPGWTCLGNEVCGGEDIRDSLAKL
jgi:N6-adenosine-specific RNA methylase IME4